MRFHLAILAAGLIPALSAAAPDERFRVYGPSQYLGYTYPHRVGGAGYEPGADFLTVGKLDGNSVGPFASMDEEEIMLRFALLRKVNPNRSTGIVDWLLDWGETYSQEVYEATMRQWIIGDSKTPLYMKDVLKAQISAESPGLRGMLEGRIAELEAKGRPLEVAVEVANEPNAFPYIPADLYAWYYARWWGLVKGQMASINSSRQAAGKAAAALKMMPAGLWTWEGMPAAMLQAIDKGFFAKVNGIQLDARVETSTPAYYNNFLASFGSLALCDSKNVPGNSSGTVRIWHVCPNEDLEPVIVTSWQYARLDGRLLSSKPTAAGTYVYYPKTWTPRPVQEMISVGNVHFYPYLGVHSSMNLATQLNSFAQLVSTMAASSASGKVWITEIGNFNPWTESQVVSDLMNPLFAELTSVRFSKVERWYWFKNGGSDSKFSMLDDLPARAGFEVKLFLYKVVNIVLDFIPGYDIPSIPTTAATQIYDMLSAMRSRNPPQGLTRLDNPRMPGPMGLAYARWARANVTGPLIATSLLLD